MDVIYLIVLFFLVIFSILDWKVRKIPAIFLTGALFIVAVINFVNLQYGIFALLLAIILYEGDFFSGLADIKVMAMMGFLVNNFNSLVIMFLLIGVYGLIYKVVLKIYHRKEKEIAFIPVFLLTYINMLIVGGILA